MQSVLYGNCVSSSCGAIIVLISSFILHATADDPDTRHPSKIEPRKDDRHASYDIDDTTWIWIPILITGLFTSLMLMSVKSTRWFDGKSMRLWLMKFVSIETLYNTLKSADAHEWKEQYDIEVGHQVFMSLGTILLIVNVFFNPNADKRYAMAVLTYLQIFALVLSTVSDVVLMKAMGRVDIVRSVNTKLRFSHCIYQVILFCTDFIGGSLHLPVDCFVWATVHYTYEAVGLAIEGLNVIGMSEFAIIAIVNAQIIGTEVAATGWTCAFGISCLVVSVLSIFGGQVFKWREALVHPRTPPMPSSSEDLHHSGSDHGSSGNKGHGSHPHSLRHAQKPPRSLRLTADTPLRSDEEMRGHTDGAASVATTDERRPGEGSHSINDGEDDNTPTIVAISRPLMEES